MRASVIADAEIHGARAARDFRKSPRKRWIAREFRYFQKETTGLT
jgi:hypothetical protein